MKMIICSAVTIAVALAGIATAGFVSVLREEDRRESAYGLRQRKQQT